MLFVCAVIAPARVWASGRASQHAAVRSDGQGEAFRTALAEEPSDPVAAAAALVALADRAPEDSFADDALTEAARISEEDLGDPARALALYRLLVARYPDSREARRARHRIELLAAGLGGAGATGGAGADHAAALAAYQAALRDATAGGLGGRARAVARVSELLARDPSFPLADRARLWLGQACLDLGRLEDSLRWFSAAARADDPALRDRARVGQAAALLAEGRFDEAEHLDRQAAASTDSVVRVAAETGLRRVRTARRRAHRAGWAALILALLVIALLASARSSLGSWRSVARALARPPVEVLYMAPVAALLVLAAQTGERRVARAVTWLLGGALAAAWLSGAMLAAVRARRPVGWRRAALHAAGAAMAALALLYLVLEREHLIDLVLATWQSGPER